MLPVMIAIGVLVCRLVYILAVRIYLDYCIKLCVSQFQFETIPQIMLYSRHNEYTVQWQSHCKHYSTNNETHQTQLLKVSLVLSSDKSYILYSYPSNLTIFISLFSSSFNHSLWMHPAYLLPYLKLERFSFVDCLQVISDWSRRHIFFLYSTGI